ncbi:DUF302 domain-containing protein [Roseibium salinum]|uniref:DUF302 domain-containing protein n=1 Tax=Roseibium salinum TaxID=1604349 RepID=A0ABT3R9E4_9HYPH|nr:DUF302 domain-containing protein [Roseibium sp. DSM 29163]MCX2725719.1 DUF302 domain-containing protein [Roseibium sp. DSM 29163]
MSYTLDRNFPASSFDDVVARTRKALADQGFGVLTEIDVKSTLKKKIGAEVDDYLILGACNPGMAHQAMQLEPRIGAMLPCNVILRKVDDGVEVSAVDPVASMTAVENDDLKTVARDVRAQLSKAVDAI